MLFSGLRQRHSAYGDSDTCYRREKGCIVWEMDGRATLLLYGVAIFYAVSRVAFHESVIVMLEFNLLHPLLSRILSRTPVYQKPSKSSASLGYLGLMAIGLARLDKRQV